MDQTVTQAIVTDQAAIKSNQTVEQIALFDSDGNPVDLASLVIQTADNTLMTGYAIAGAYTAVAPADTINEAVGKVEYLATTPYDVVLTGYVIDGTGGALADTDTLMEAIAKLEKRVADLEAAS